MRRVWPFTLRGTGAVALALASFAIANELGVAELVYVGVLLLALVAAGLASLYLVRRTEGVTRSLDPDVTAVGGETVVTARIAMRSALPSAPGTWRDTLPAALRGRAEGSFPALSSSLRAEDRAITVDYTVTGVRRGVHRLGPLTVTSTDPFGLASRSHVLGQRTMVTVAPAIVDLPALTDLPGEAGGTLHTTTNRLGQGTDNLVPRGYEAGDSMRRIHWRASAHRGELMVRQEEQESTPAATVVLDLGVQRWAPDALRAAGLDPAFERGLSAAVSAVARLVHEGFTVTLIDSDGTPFGGDPIDGGDLAAVEALATHLATLTARRDDHLAGLPGLFIGTSAGPVVLIVGRIDAADADALAALPHHSALPLLMPVAASADAVRVAAATGWRLAEIPQGADLAEAWSAAIDRGVSHVFS